MFICIVHRRKLAGDIMHIFRHWFYALHRSAVVGGTMQLSHPDNDECQYFDPQSTYLIPAFIYCSTDITHLSVCPQTEASSCLSLYLCCAGFLLSHFHPSSSCLPSKDVMGHREETRFNHNSSHDCSTNTAIQKKVSLKQSMFYCAWVSCVILS